MIRFVAGLLVVLVVAWAGIAVAAWALQRQLIYFPARTVPAAAAVGLPDAEPVLLRTSDGLTLDAWFVPTTAEPPVPAVVVFNGNGGNRAGRAPLAAVLRDAGFAVLLMDYRGYGGNPGRPSEAGLVRDGSAAVAYLHSRDDVDATRIIYFGESLGAGVATAVAAQRPPAAMILRSPFVSLTDVAQVHYPYLPVGTLLREHYPTAEHVAGYDGPLLVIAGSADGIVPAAQSRAVADAAGGRSRFVLIDGADHNDPALFDGREMVAEILRFLRRSPGGRPVR